MFTYIIAKVFFSTNYDPNIYIIAQIFLNIPSKTCDLCICTLHEKTKIPARKSHENCENIFFLLIKHMKNIEK